MAEEEEKLARARARVGQVLREKWTLDALLGVGGMATVYAATHRNKKRGAVKILHPEFSADANVRQRFLREGYLANSVGHRGAVEVFDDDIAESGEAYLVMELLQGETLESRLERKGNKLGPIEVLSLMDQLLETLTEAHAKDIIHRDLKPENLFLTTDRVVKVLDFGIARIKEVGDKSSSTQSGTPMGTPAFMAPEQARSRWEEVESRTDLWAVGAVMFTLLTGRFVHGEGTASEVMARAINFPVPSLATIDPSIDPEIVALVDRALAYEKNDRFPDAVAMQAELRRVYQMLVQGAEQPQPLSLPPMPGDAIGAVPAEHLQDPSLFQQKARSTPTTGGGLTATRSEAGSNTGKRWIMVAAGAFAVALALGMLFIGGDEKARSEKLAPASTPSAPERPAAPNEAALTPVPEPEPSTVDVDALPVAPSAAASVPKPVDAPNPVGSAPKAAPPKRATGRIVRPPAELFKKRD